MSKRLQVLMSEQEMRDLKAAAERAEVSVGEWVRRTVNATLRKRSLKPPDEKMRAMLLAMQVNGPSAEVRGQNGVS